MVPWLLLMINGGKRVHIHIHVHRVRDTGRKRERERERQRDRETETARQNILIDLLQYCNIISKSFIFFATVIFI